MPKKKRPAEDGGKAGLQAKELFAERLLAWAKLHGRSGLPWQGKGAYEVWVSEIMLQQTRVETAIDYYQRFLERFPTIGALAKASEEDVLAAWSGLGYYQRARNLRMAAQIADRDFKGALPGTAEELATLPGIGRSTAAAIASLCHNERVAILDGNAKRSITRVFAVKESPQTAKGMAKLWDLAEKLVPEDAKAYTQAIMDLGATICLPTPRCELCPMTDFCQGKSDPGSFPAKKAMASAPSRKEKEETWELAHDGSRVAMVWRPKSNGVWRGMLALPESPGETPAGWSKRETIRHDFSHYRLFAKIMEKRMRPKDLDAWAAKSKREVFRIADALEQGIPSPVRKLLESLLPDRQG